MAILRRVTTQDISWFLDLDRNSQLDLEPTYQRRSVWSPSDRRYFLDTIFRGYPSPPVFLHKQVIDGKTIYSVVDGKQRLETIFRFANNKIAINKDFGDERLAGKRWNAIRKYEELAHSFWDYIVPVEFTDITDDIGLINEVFDRLNRNSVKLVEQELRHAKYDGWLITFVETESELPEWKELGITTTARAKRMRNVQFLSELLIVLLKGNVGGFDQIEITEHYANYDDLSDLEFHFDESAIRQQFSSAKGYLLELERSSSIINDYARDFTNFYSLWALIVLNSSELPTIGAFSKRYSEFIREVSKYRDEEFLEKVISGDEKPSFAESLRYYQSSTGASTEPPQRSERNNALKAVLLEAH